MLIITVHGIGTTTAAYDFAWNRNYAGSYESLAYDMRYTIGPNREKALVKLLALSSSRFIKLNVIKKIAHRLEIVIKKGMDPSIIFDPIINDYVITRLGVTIDNLDDIEEEIQMNYNMCDFSEFEKKSTEYEYTYGTPRHSIAYPLKLNIKVTNVVTHNDRVVIVYFSDGTFTKAVCNEKDIFDLDVGIQVCLLKKIFGEKNYYKNMREIHKVMEAKEEAKKKVAEEKKARRAENERRAEKNRVKRQNHIDNYKNDIVDAILYALRARDEEVANEEMS